MRAENGDQKCSGTRAKTLAVVDLTPAFFPPKNDVYELNVSFLMEKSGGQRVGGLRVRFSLRTVFGVDPSYEALRLRWGGAFRVSAKGGNTTTKMHPSLPFSSRSTTRCTTPWERLRGKAR